MAGKTADCEWVPNVAMFPAGKAVAQLPLVASFLAGKVNAAAHMALVTMFFEGKVDAAAHMTLVTMFLAGTVDDAAHMTLVTMFLAGTADAAAQLPFAALFTADAVYAAAAQNPVDSAVAQNPVDAFSPSHEMTAAACECVLVDVLSAACCVSVTLIAELPSLSDLTDEQLLIAVLFSFSARRLREIWLKYLPIALLEFRDHFGIDCGIIIPTQLSGDI